MRETHITNIKGKSLEAANDPILSFPLICSFITLYHTNSHRRYDKRRLSTVGFILWKRQKGYPDPVIEQRAHTCFAFQKRVGGLMLLKKGVYKEGNKLF